MKILVPVFTWKSKNRSQDIVKKRRKLLLRSNFSSFPHYSIFLTSGVKLHIHLLNVVVRFIVFLTLSTLICRGTDISKCFSGSLVIRDNDSRLQLKQTLCYQFSCVIMPRRSLEDILLWACQSVRPFVRHAFETMYARILKYM